uniref:Uncharacterized protein n=1 Tax=Clytia hemisphaerica TaxID=252671 RepID=A0A7M5VBD2_9CNID
MNSSIVTTLAISLLVVCCTACGPQGGTQHGNRNGGGQNPNSMMGFSLLTHNDECVSQLMAKYTSMEAFCGDQNSCPTANKCHKVCLNAKRFACNLVNEDDVNSIKDSFDK